MGCPSQPDSALMISCCQYLVAAMPFESLRWKSTVLEHGVLGVASSVDAPKVLQEYQVLLEQSSVVLSVQPSQVQEQAWRTANRHLPRGQTEWRARSTPKRSRLSSCKTARAVPVGRQRNASSRARTFAAQ